MPTDPKMTTIGESLEELLATMDAPPSDAQKAYGRRLAEILDADETPTAAMMGRYAEWLNHIEADIPGEPDAIDEAQT